VVKYVYILMEAFEYKNENVYLNKTDKTEYILEVINTNENSIKILFRSDYYLYENDYEIDFLMKNYKIFMLCENKEKLISAINYLIRNKNCELQLVDEVIKMSLKSKFIDNEYECELELKYSINEEMNIKSLTKQIVFHKSVISKLTNEVEKLIFNKWNNNRIVLLEGKVEELTKVS